MSKKIRPATENKVIQNFLHGMTREHNAADCYISPASVSNIVNGLLGSLSIYDREAVVDFVQLRKEKISVKDCAKGNRIYNILNALGISDDDNNFENFLKDIYDLYGRLSIHPHIMEECIVEIVKLSKYTSLSQMKPYLERKNKEIETMEDKVEQTKDEISKIEHVLVVTEENFAARKKKIEIASADLAWYINIKDSLEREGLPVEDLSYLTRLIVTIKKYTNKEIFIILEKIFNSEKLDKEIESKKDKLELLAIDIETAKQLDEKFSKDVSSKTLQLELVDQIKKLSFDIRDLTKIRLCLTEISSENNISPLEIKQRFFEILSRYGRNIMLEKDKENHEYLISDLDREITKKRSILLSQGSIGIVLRNLLERGLNENDIILVKKLYYELEKIYVNPNTLNRSRDFPKPSIPLSQINKANKEFNISIPTVSKKIFISKDLDPNLEKNKINMNLF